MTHMRGFFIKYLIRESCWKRNFDVQIMSFGHGVLLAIVSSFFSLIK